MFLAYLFQRNKYVIFTVILLTLSLFGGITRALETYKHKHAWRDIQIRVMQESNSWEIPAKKYVALYYKALCLKNGNGKNKK